MTRIIGKNFENLGIAYIVGEKKKNNVSMPYIWPYGSSTLAILLLGTQLIVSSLRKTTNKHNYTQNIVLCNDNTDIQIKPQGLFELCSQ